MAGKRSGNMFSQNQVMQRASSKEAAMETAPLNAPVVPVTKQNPLKVSPDRPPKAFSPKTKRGK